jgi:hypothetical protein
MEKQALDKSTSDKISFMTYIVPAFADAYKMNVQDAFHRTLQKNMAGNLRNTKNRNLLKFKHTITHKIL